MHIEFEVSEDDFVAASQLATHRRSVATRIRLWVLRIVGVGFFVFALLLLTQPGSKIFPVFLLCYSMYPCFWPLFTKRRAAKRFQKMPQMHGTHVWDVGPDGVRVATSDSVEINSWHVYDRLVEDKKSILLVLRGNFLFHPLPKRQLTPEQITELRSLIETHLPRK